MSRRVKIWLGVLGCFVAAIALVVIFFDWNWLRGIAEAQASAELDRPVKIAHLDVKLARQPLVIVDGFEVGNPPEFPNGTNVAVFERMAFTVDVARYLKTGTFFFPEMTLYRPALTLERAPSGKPNWVIDRFTATDPDATSPSAPEIGRLTVNDGSVQVLDPKAKTDIKLAVHTEADPKGGDSQIVVAGKGKYDNAPTEIEARTGSLASFRDANSRYPVDLAWAVGPTRAHIVGTVANRSNLAGIDGKLEVSGPDMSLLYPMTGVPFPPTPPYKLAGRLWHAGAVVHFDTFDGKVGSSDLSGSLAVDTGGPRLVLTGDINSGKTAVADLAGFVGSTPGKPDAANSTPQQKAQARSEAASAKALPVKPVNLEKLNEIDAHLVYRVKHLDSDTLPVDDLMAKLDLENGRLQLRPLNFGVGKGRISMALDLNARTNPPRWNIDANFQNIDLQRIMNKTMKFDASGLVGGRAQIVSVGGTASDVLANGDGHVTLAMTGGQISAVLTELAGLDLLEALGFSIANKDKKFAIRCMVADAGMEKGLLQTKTFVIDTTDTNIGGTGAINFRDETMNFKLEAQPKDVSLLTFRAPVLITGTLKHPKVGIDPATEGARVGAMAALGALLTPLAALIPTIELGLGKDSDCAGLVDQAARSSQQAETIQKKKPDPRRGQKARR